MPSWEPPDLFGLLAAAATGDAPAKEELVKAIYQELRQIAGAFMRHERVDHTLQPTALVHEAIVRLWQGKELAHVVNRAHLFAAATTAMRQVLLDHHRTRAAQKRGGDRERVPLDDLEDNLKAQGIDFGDLHD